MRTMCDTQTALSNYAAPCRRVLGRKSARTLAHGCPAGHRLVPRRSDKQRRAHHKQLQLVASSGVPLYLIYGAPGLRGVTECR